MENFTMTELEAKTYNRRLEEGTLKKYLLNKVEYRVRVKGLSEELKTLKHSRKKRVVRNKSLRDKYGKELPCSNGMVTTEELALSDKVRMTYLARAFILGMPYNKVEANSKSTGYVVSNVHTLEKIVVELFGSEYFYPQSVDQKCCYQFILDRYKNIPGIERVAPERKMRYAILFWLA